MDEEGIAAVAVSGVVPRPLEILTFVLLEYKAQRCSYMYKFSARFKLWCVMQCIPDVRIYKNDIFYPFNSIVCYKCFVD